jgi:hypothetical protein
MGGGGCPFFLIRRLDALSHSKALAGVTPQLAESSPGFLLGYPDWPPPGRFEALGVDGDGLETGADEGKPEASRKPTPFSRPDARRAVWEMARVGCFSRVSRRRRFDAAAHNGK